jgi:hypothetical protein
MASHAAQSSVEDTNIEAACDRRWVRGYKIVRDVTLAETLAMKGDLAIL